MKEPNEPTKLQGIPKKDVFKAPEGYFESLEERVLNRIDRPGARVVPIARWVAAAVAIAASVALVVLIQPSSTPAPGASELLAQVPDEDFALYVSTIGFETEELMEAAGATLGAGDALYSIDSLSTVLPENEEILYQRYGVTNDENFEAI